jgi:hypothetical protein
MLHPLVLKVPFNSIMLSWHSFELEDSEDSVVLEEPTVTYMETKMPLCSLPNSSSKLLPLPLLLTFALLLQLLNFARLLSSRIMTFS